MTKIISVEQTILVRWAALRANGPIESCTIPPDKIPNSFHVGHEIAGKIVGVASFYPISKEGENGVGWQLRMMGVLPEYQRKGIGNAVLKFGIEFLIQNIQPDYLWCNARKIAYEFYEKIGFSLISEEFDIAGIGSHRAMRIDLR